MSFSALLCAQSFPVRYWDTARADQILIELGRIYFNVPKSQNMPDTETLSLNYLPNQARWKVQSPIEVSNSSAEANNSTQSRFDGNSLRQSPAEASNSIQSSVEANISTQSRADINRSNQWRLEATPMLPANESPITVTNTDLTIKVEPVEAQIYGGPQGTALQIKKHTANRKKPMQTKRKHCK